MPEGGSGGINVNTGVLRKSAGHCEEIARAFQGGSKRPEAVGEQAGAMLRQQAFELGPAMLDTVGRWTKQSISVLQAIELTGRNLNESARGHSSTDNGLAQQMQGLGSQFH